MTNQPTQRSRQLPRLLMGVLTLALLVVAFPISSDAAATAMCAGRTVTVDIGAGDVPTDGDDIILGTSGDDIIDALAGKDVICAGGGDDTVHGGDQGDVIYGEDGNDKIYGEQGYDKIWGGAGDDKIYGDTGKDTLRGGHGVDLIRGGKGNDTIEGGTGADDLKGNDGIDTIAGGNHDDTIQGNDGADIIDGGSGDDDIEGNRGDDTIDGGEGNDMINGGTHDDVINGGTGEDTVAGGNHDDTIAGGPGNDIAEGGDGEDSCDAETVNSCETSPTLPPDWVAGSQMTLESMSRWDMRVSWCCTAGGLASPALFDITITDSSGSTDRATINASDPWEFTLDNFGGYALEPGELYSIEVVAVNAAGETAPIGLIDIGHLEFDVETTPEGDSSSSQSRGIIRQNSGYYDSDCLSLSSTLRMKQNKRLRIDTHVTFELLSYACHDGSVFTTNRPTRSCIVTRGSGDLETVLETSPTSATPLTAQVRNLGGCNIDQQSTRTIGITVEHSGLGGRVERTEQVVIDVSMSIDHVLDVWGPGICWMATSAPVNDGGIFGEDCPARPTPTG